MMQRGGRISNIGCKVQGTGCRMKLKNKCCKIMLFVAETIPSSIYSEVYQFKNVSIITQSLKERMVKG